MVGNRPTRDEEEKREAQERLNKIERELAIIVANMKHTNERFDTER